MNSDLVIHLGVWDYVIFVSILAVSLFIGLYYAFKRNEPMTVVKYLVGDRKMGVLPVALSLFATYNSSITMLGLPTEVYMYDVGALFSIFVAFISFPVVGYCYLPIFYDLKCISCKEYLEKRFNRKIRALSSFITILQTMVYAGMTLLNPSLSLSQASGLNVWLCLAIIGSLGTIYTSMGGIKAVMWTDVFQALIMFTCLILTVVRGTLDVGGLDYVFTKAKEGGRLHLNYEMDLRIRYTIWSTTIAGFIRWTAAFGLEQTFVQRYVSCKSKRKAQISLYLNLLGSVLYYACLLVVGLLIYAKYSDCDPISTGRIKLPDQLFPLFVVETLHSYSGLNGLFLGALFSASLSTLSSSLNSITALILEDFLKNWKLWKRMSAKRLTDFSKISTVAFGILAIALVPLFANMGSIYKTTYYNAHTFRGMNFGLYVLGMFVPWANSFGASFGLLVGFIFSQWISIGSQMHPAYTPTSVLSTSGCDAGNLSASSPWNSTDEQSDVFPLYQISHGWIIVLSSLPVIIIGMIFSAFFHPTKISDLDMRLLSPPVRFLIRKLFPIQARKNCTDVQNQTEVHLLQ